MKLQGIISITGLPGLFRAMTNRANGLIVEELATQKTSFVSARKHNFTPLESIAIYTLDGTEELIDVFRKIRERKDEVPLPENKASKMELMQYFDEVLPDYDEDRVHIKDMKKVVKWYKQLEELGYAVEYENNEFSERDVSSNLAAKKATKSDEKNEAAPDTKSDHSSEEE